MDQVANNYDKAVAQYRDLMASTDLSAKYSGKWIAVSKQGDYVIGNSETQTAGTFINSYPNEIQYYIGPVGGDPNTVGIIYKKMT